MMLRATALLCLFWLTACGPKKEETSNAKIESRPFGKMPSGQEVDLFTLTNSKGIEAGIITYGARLVSLKTPDRSGHFADIVLGFDNMDGYLK